MSSCAVQAVLLNEAPPRARRENVLRKGERREERGEAEKERGERREERYLEDEACISDFEGGSERMNLFDKVQQSLHSLLRLEDRLFIHQLCAQHRLHFELSLGIALAQHCIADMRPVAGRDKLFMEHWDFVSREEGCRAPQQPRNRKCSRGRSGGQRRRSWWWRRRHLALEKAVEVQDLY